MPDGLDFQKTLTEKVGGLPGFAWVGIGLGGYLLYRKFKPSAPVAAASVDTTSAPIPASTVTDKYGNIVSAPLGTNSAWASTAANQLMSTGSYTASDIQTALANYLSGNGVSALQQGIVNAALNTFGTPPEGVIPVYQPYVDPYAGTVSALPIITPSTNTPFFPQTQAPATPTITPDPWAGFNMANAVLINPTPNVSAAGTVSSGGTLLGSGAIAGATDSAGNKVFVPAPGAPSVSSVTMPAPANHLWGNL